MTNECLETSGAQPKAWCGRECIRPFTAANKDARWNSETAATETQWVCLPYSIGTCVLREKRWPRSKSKQCRVLPAFGKPPADLTRAPLSQSAAQLAFRVFYIMNASVCGRWGNRSVWEDACRIQSRSEKYGCSRGCGPKATPVGDFLHPRQRRSPFIYIGFLHLSLSISHFGPDAEVICVYAFYYALRCDFRYLGPGCCGFGGARKKWTICRCHVGCLHVWVITSPLGG